ncbi:MAG: FAD-binding oxidoreductase [Anaerolineales bacterium]
MTTKTFDVILAGGGVMSCATAYYLLRFDPSLNVAIVEKDPTYAKSSTVLSDGNIRLQFNIKENVQISQFGLEVLKTFKDDMEVNGEKPDPMFRQEGNLFLVDQNGLETAKQGLALQQSLGCPVEWLSAQEAMQRFPLYQLDNLAGGTFGSLDGTMDPNTVLTGMKKKVVAMGATYLEGRVTEILTNKGRVTGVKLSSGETLKSECILNGTGAWGTDLAKTAGVHLPVQPVKRQVFTFEVDTIPDAVMPLTVFPSGLYLIHEHGNRFMAGRSFEDDPIGLGDFEVDRNIFLDRMWPELVEYVPACDRLKLTGGWAGLYAVNTFDGNAILGEWPELKGFYLANGFSGHGFQQCFAVGRYTAELMLARTPSLDLSIFSAKRILENKPVFENPHKLV